VEKYYFFLVKPGWKEDLGEAECVLTHPMFRNVSVELKVLFVELNGEKQEILPYVYEIIEVNPNPVNVRLHLVREYTESASVRSFITALQQGGLGAGDKKIPDGFTNVEAFTGRLLQSGIWRIDMPKLIEVCVSLMGVPKGPTERGLLQAIHNHITARGYYFEEETLYDYHICLKTRPFVILAGLSGTGKSKLSQLYAEALGHYEHYLRVPVRPNWNNDHYILGYYNTLTDEYMTEPLIEKVIDANEHREQLYFICLDEMNLAHVEYYFAQFLSALEGDREEERKITLLGDKFYQSLIKQGKRIPVPAQLELPPNLLFTGTINVDETTKSISDKVIDRANTIEFFSVDLDKIPPRRSTPEPQRVSAEEWLRYRVEEPDTSYRQKIIAINSVLSTANIGFGYRVVREIEMYLANSQGLLDLDTAFDLQVKQRILPRVRGTEVIRNMLEALTELLQSYQLPRSVKRVQEMNDRLDDGYTSFWR
jgi:hypothetical protein